MASSKPFESIQDDYAFFEHHATEAAADVRAYLPHLQQLAKAHPPLRLLDFGCGAGHFAAHLFARTQWPPHRLALALVEPDAGYRRQATERLQAYTSHPVQAWPHLPVHVEASFDVVLANHVFYYVVELHEAVHRLLQTLAKPGLLLTSMAGQRNDLIQLWNACFDLLEMPVPFHTAEDLEGVFAALGLRYQRQDVQYALVFPDSQAHRLHLLRFLLGPYFREEPLEALLDLFEPYRQGGLIVMEPVHEQFAVCP